ncbi:MAG: hypothetical protein AAGA24_00270 [Pseudomonadota bacterium]
MTQRRRNLGDWRLWAGGLGVCVLGAGVLIVATTPRASDTDVSLLIDDLAVFELPDAGTLSSETCRAYRDKIAYLRECKEMFARGATGPCPARAAPDGVAVPSHEDELEKQISGLQTLSDEGCSAPYPRLAPSLFVTEPN